MAFLDPYRKCYRDVHRVLAALSGSRLLADDLSQEAFLDLVRHGTSGVRNLNRYVIRIAVRRWREYTSREQPVLEPLPDDLPDPGADTDYDIDRRQHLRWIGERLDALPSEERAALVLVSMMGYPVNEASAILELPRTTVVSQHRRAVERLRRKLRKAAV
jgi:RNA polymerase sigma-70 factor (ECF subfamily)